MGKKKTTTKNEYKFLERPDTQDIKNVRESVKNVDFHTPILQQFAQAENDVDDSYLENSLPDGVKEKIRLSRLFSLRQQKGAALSNAANQENIFTTGNQMNLAQLTNSPLVNSSSTQTQSGGFMDYLMPAVGAGAMIAAAIPTGGASAGAAAPAGA